MNPLTFLEDNKNLFDYIEGEKVKYYRQAIRIKLGGMIVAVLFVLLFFTPQFISGYSVLTTVLVTIFFLACATLPFLVISNHTIIPSKTVRSFYNTCKTHLAGNIIRMISDNLDYRPQNRVHNNHIHQSQLFGSKITEAKGRNLITGQLGSSEIEMSELQLWGGLPRIFNGFFVSVSNIREANVDTQALKKLKGNWVVRDNNLFMAFPGMDKFFEIRIEKSDRTIVRTKARTRFILQVVSIIERAAGATFASSYKPENLPEASEEALRAYKTFRVPETGEEFILVSNTRRFLNAVIDFTAIQLLCFPVMTGVSLTGFRTGDREVVLLVYVAVLLCVALIYYFLTELVFGGTIGKQFTRSRMIMTDGTRPGFRALLIRTLSRFIPFEAYSYINSETGLHDRLSKTRVVRSDIKPGSKHKNS